MSVIIITTWEFIIELGIAPDDIQSVVSNSLFTEYIVVITLLSY